MMRNQFYTISYCFCLVLLSGYAVARGGAAATLTPLQSSLLKAGDEMLENLEISYVYGGAKVGSPAECETCNSCLEEKKPSPKERFVKCPSCGGCSLDCSHFTQLVQARVGLEYPYITTSQMAELPRQSLAVKYGFIDVGNDPQKAVPGDLLVYRGHVVMLESSPDHGFGNVIHATGGKDIKVPGQGIQRERHAQLASFRGSLLRILRHRKVEGERVALLGGTPVGADAKVIPGHRLRPVEKKNPY